MVEYLDIQGFISRFSEAEIKQIASDGKHNSAEGAQIDIVRVQAALDFARDMINARVLRRYPGLKGLDVTVMPALLAGFAGDIARYRLRNKAAQKHDASELVEERYQHALEQLDLIMTGKIDLLDDDGNSLAGSEEGEIIIPDTAGSIHMGATSGASSDSFLNGYCTGYGLDD